MVPNCGLPVATRSGWKFETVVHGVADHVDEWIAKLLDDVAIELGLLALQQKLHLFVLLRGEIAHEAIHLMKHPANRDHPQRHCVALQLRGYPTELTQAAHELQAVDFLDVGVLDHH